MDKPVEMVRVNTRISKLVNDWLEERTRVTGVPKSTLIYLALEQYIQQIDVVTAMKDMNGIFEILENRFDNLDKQINKMAAQEDRA